MFKFSVTVHVYAKPAFTAQQKETIHLSHLSISYLFIIITSQIATTPTLIVIVDLVCTF